MRRVLHGNLVYAPALGALETAEHAYLVTENGIVTGQFSALPQRFLDDPIDDFHDALILPAFTDLHLHAPQYPMLGMGMDLPLLDWLERYTFRTEARFADPDYARAVYRTLANALIRNGTTRVSMFSSLHTDATLILMEELERAGISGLVGKVSMDRNSPAYYTESTEESKRETLRWLKACERFTRVRPILTPRFTPSCSDRLMRWLGDLAKESDLPVQSHLSENRSEIAWVKELAPDCERYWETYAKAGLWKPGTLMAHCVYSDAIERKAMRDYGVTAVHCADSNINIASGIAPVRVLLEEGTMVALGSDIAGGAQLNMLEVMQMTIRASKIKRIETDWQTPFLTVAEAFYLGTTAGAAYFGHAPGFPIGKRLHAVVIDDRTWGDIDRLTIAERFERAVYLAKEPDIIAVYADGVRRK